jgi:hypothetical protein
MRRRFRELLHGERGMALPVALFAMIASMALASAAVMATIDVQQGSHRDDSSKSAIAAADAGVNVARLRMARYAYVLNSTTPCLRVGTTGLLEGSKAETVAGSSWCPAITGTVGGSTYSYRTSPAGATCGTYSLCVVATGTADGVSRRVEVTFNSSNSSSSSGTEEKKEEAGQTWSTGVGIDGVIGSEKIQIDNKGDARVNVGTNGDVTVGNGGNVCGDIRHGIGKKVENSGTQCKGYKVTEGNVSLPPVSSFMPSNISEVNSNYRLVQCTKTSPSKVPTGCQSDSYSTTAKGANAWASTVPWNSATRTISTANNGTLTLTGGDYFICKLELNNNSALIMGAGATVRIFFDTPEHCGLKAGAKQIEISNNSSVTATGYQPALGKYDLPGFYLTGSTSIKTSVELSPNGTTNEFILYAPNTDILIKNNAVYVGIIAGQTVHLENAIIKQDGGFSVPTALNPWKEATVTNPGGSTTPVATYFSPQSYVECSGVATTGLAPNADC